MRVLDPSVGPDVAVHDNNFDPPAMPKQRIWDVCAPKLIVEKANGVFLNTSGEPYNPAVDRTPIILASNAKAAQAVIDIGNGRE